VLDLLSSLEFYLVSVPAVLIYGISKGGFGGIFGVLSVPLMAIVISPSTAAAILLPLLMVMDVFVLRKFWKTFDKRCLWILLPSALIGIAFGYFSVDQFSEDNLRFLVGLIAIVFGLQHFIVGKGSAKKLGKKDGVIGMFWGSIAGFTSFHVHAGGPPVSAYLIPKQMPPTIFAGTAGIFFSCVNLFKLPAYIAAGQISKESLFVSAVFLPLVPVSVLIG